MAEKVVYGNVYPLCERCGHTSGMHSTTKCVEFVGARVHNDRCDCPGWLPPRREATDD